MPKARRKSSRTKKEIDPLDVSDQMFIKEEKIEIKKEVLDLDINIVPGSDVQLELKQKVEDFSNDNFLVDQINIPGIEKIVNIEDILKNNLNSVDSTNLLNSENVNRELQNSKISPEKNSAVSSSTSNCHCMQHVKHYCYSCDVVSNYKIDKSECSVCKTTLKLQCSKCNKKYKFLSSSRQYVVQYSKKLNLLSNQKRGIVLKCQKQVNFCCSVCSFKTESKEKFDLHVKTHSVVEQVKQNDHSKEVKQDRFDDDFIELFCKKCFKTVKNLSYKNHTIYSCKECKEAMFYQCKICRKLYKSLINIRPHVNFRCLKLMEYYKFHCNHCCFKTEDKSKLELHVTTRHMPVICKHCKKEFVNSVALKQHNTKGCTAIKSKTETDIHQNYKNNLSYSIPWHEEGSYEVVEYHPDELYNKICNKPRKDLYSSSEWQSMIDYFCLLCGGQTDRKFSKYKPWCRTCKIKYEYRCKICAKIYNGHSNIANHVKSECPARYRLACNLCDFTSIQKNILITHIKNKHTVFKCIRCESRYHGHLSLKRHLLNNCLIRNDDKNLQTIIALYCKKCCNRVIKFEDASLKPCLKCSAIMSYECLKCNQLFNDQEVAQKHVKNECSPQLNCTKCSYKTYIQYELDVHMKDVHTNHKTCPDCGYKTYNQYELDVHMKHVHTNDKKCPDCGVQFRDEEIFQRHRLEELRRKAERKSLFCKQGAKRIKLTNR